MSDHNLAQTTLPAAGQPRPAFSRVNLALLALLALQLVAVAWVYRPRATGAAGTPLLPGVSADQVTRLRIADADRSVELERAGDGWVMAGTDGYPANTEKITTTLASLIGVTTDRLVATTPASHARLQVAPNAFARQVTLTTPDGDQAIYLGSSAGAGATHVRLDGNDATYLTSGLDVWQLDTAPSSWVNATYFSLPADEVVALTLQNANGTLTFVKDENGEWTLQDRAPDEQVLAANISTLVTRATGVNLTVPLGTADKPEYGMADPLATLTLQTQNAQGETAEYTLVMGAKDADNTYVFKASSSPHYVRIAGFTGDEFASKKRADFLPQPEAADGSAAPAPAAAITGTNPASATGALTPAQAITATAPLTAAPPISGAETPTVSGAITPTETTTITSD
ncbi:MAG: DUF4340 domain-containing protein [Caldilineaceae bacterium]|nr:DUF4340 domain-containing protein [Caldilineaceae bacterium]